MFDHMHGKRRRNRRETLRAAGISALVHVLVVVLLAWGIQREVLLANDLGGDGPALVFPDPGGGGGGGGAGGEEVVSYVDLPPPPPPVEEEPVKVEEDELIPPEETPPPQPPAPTPPQPDPTQPRPQTPAPAGAQQGTGGGESQGQGPGSGPGVGPGSGGGTGGGAGGGNGPGQGPGDGGGSRIRPPTTDFLLIPPEKPRGVRAQELTIRVRVDERGRVKAARLLTGTGNRGYDEQIRRWAMQLGFRPAVNLDTNRPVEVDYDLTIAV